MSDPSEKLQRFDVEAMNEILGVPFRVLDDGFVRVVDYMGSDESIVQAARISYGKGTKKVHEDRGLIRYLMRHRHTTPIEMCEIKLHVKVPMDCWRQWIRHRTANVNEYSTRYSEAIDVTQKTERDSWRQQAQTNKQGSGELIDAEIGSELSRREEELHAFSRETYKERINAGVAREQARKDLPLSTYTEAYWKIDLHNLFHFLSLRMDLHAQFEIRSYAEVIGNEIVKRWCPIAWEAFVDYRLKGMLLSRLEADIIRELIPGNNMEATNLAEAHGLLSYGPGGLKSNRERQELEAKLAVFGLLVPWTKSPPRIGKTESV